MRTEDYVSGFPGTLVPTIEGCLAFVPDPLPPRLDLGNPELFRLYGQACGSIGSLRELFAGSSIDPWILVYPLMRREAVFSSRIEGTHTTPTQMAMFEAQGKDQPPDPATGEAREVDNYFQAMGWALSQVQQGGMPITQNLLKEAHARLLRGIRRDRDRPGEYRTVQNYIGRRTGGIQGARFVPPPPPQTILAMNDLESFINHSLSPNSTPPPLIGIALAHYQFEAIHPFRDGNGRIGRLLVALQIIASGMLPDAILHISPVLDTRRDEYVERMLRVSTEGRWLEWVSFFLEVVIAAADDAIRKAKKLIEIRTRYRDLCTKPRKSTMLHRIIDQLFRSPIIGIREAARVAKVTEVTASAYLHALETMGVLEPLFKERQRNRRYISNEIAAIAFEGV